MTELSFEQFQKTGMDFGDGSHTYYPGLRDINDNRVEIEFMPLEKIDLKTYSVDFVPVPQVEGAFIGTGNFLFIVVADQNLVSSLPQLERALYDLLGERDQL